MTLEGRSPKQGHRSAAARLVVLVCLLLLLLYAPPSSVPTGPGGGPPSRAPSPPKTLILQPDSANGTDTAILDSTPAWNYGANPSLWVGRDPANGTMSRSLLKFALTGLPANATVVNATLDLYQYAGDVGIVQLRRATAPWTEGFGEESWTQIPVTVRETAGARRTSEPVGVNLTFPAGSVVNPARDLRVFLGAGEIPSQAYSCGYSGAFATGCLVYFGASVAPRGTLAFNVTTGANATSVPGYRTRTLGAAPLWTAGPVGSGASGVSVVDINGDGVLDVLFGTADGAVEAVSGDTGRVIWRTALPTARSVPYSPQVRDIDGDGALDIVVLVNDFSLVRLNRTGAVVWTAPISNIEEPLSTPTLVDVTGDGVLDVLVGGKSKRVDAYNGTNGAFLRSYPAGDWAFTPSVSDVDRDGVGEIFFASDDFRIHAYNASGTQRWSAAAPGVGFIENSVAIGDIDGDGYPDIVSGDDTNGGPEFALNATNGGLLWARPIPAYREGGQTLADINGDGRLEVVVGLYSGAVYALYGVNGTTMWAATPGGTTQVAAPSVVDINDDGSPEILYMDMMGTAVRVLDSSGNLVYTWTVPANDPGFRGLSQKLMASPVVADVNGDGTLEVVVPTGSGVQAFPTGGLARDWRTWGYNWNHTHLAYDGSSPDGTPALSATRGPLTFVPARGASWGYRDGGGSPWLVPGGDFGNALDAQVAFPGWIAWNVTSSVADWHTGAAPNFGVFLWGGVGPSFGWHAFYSSDAPNPLLRPRLLITYTIPSVDPVPRIVGRIPDLARQENSPPVSRDLSSYARDEDSPLSELRWNVTGYDPAIVEITGLNVPGNHILTFYPRPNAWGHMRVTYWVSDLQGHYSRQGAWVNITFVNQPPTFDPPATLLVRFNRTYTFGFGPYIRDVDDPPSNLTLTSGDPLHASVSGLNVSFLYPESYVNQWVFVGLAVRDREFTVGKVVAVKVTTDDPPVVTRRLPDVTMLEGQILLGVFNLNDFFSDPDNDTLSFSHGYSHLDIAIQANRSVDFRAPVYWNGVEDVSFRARDSKGAIAEDTMRVTVLPVDHPPVLGPVPDLRVRYDANYSFNLDPYISDPDTPLDRIVASTSSGYVNVSGHILVLRYPQSLNGTVQPLTITISDGKSSDSRAIRVTVGDEWPPNLIAKMPDRSFPEDGGIVNAYNLSQYFRDPDDSSLFWSSGNRSVLVSIDARGLVSLRALRDWFGTELVTFRAMDPKGGLAEDAVWVTILPVNDAPYFSPVPTILMNATTAYVDLAPYLHDVDTNVSNLVLSSTSPHVFIVGHGLILNYSADGTDTFTVFVSDGDLTNSTEVIVVVSLTVPGDRIPGYLPWLPLPILAAALAVVLAYRWRRVDWVLLATNNGLLVSSIFRQDPAALDTDLITGMLTAIMNFAKASFSSEDSERELDDLTLGDRRVTVVRGNLGYLAVVYKGRTAGFLPRTMRGILAHIEERYPKALGTVVDSTDLEDIPVLLKRFLDRAWLPVRRLGA